MLIDKMKIEVGKTYKNHYGVQIEIFEAPIKDKCVWFKGAVNDGTPTWKVLPYYYHEDGSFFQFPSENAKFNLIVDKPTCSVIRKFRITEH